MGQNLFEQALNETEVVICQPSYQYALTDINRINLQINDLNVDTSEEKVLQEGLMLLYSKYFNDYSMALFFALNNHQRSLYQFFAHIQRMIMLSPKVIGDNGLIREEYQPLMLAIANPEAFRFTVKIKQLEKNKYSYEAILVGPNDENKSFVSISTILEREGENVKYNECKVALSDTAKELIGEDNVTLLDNKIKSFTLKSYPLVEAAKLNISSRENNEFLDKHTSFPQESQKINPTQPFEKLEITLEWWQILMGSIYTGLSKLAEGISFFFKNQKSNYSPAFFMPPANHYSPILVPPKAKDTLQHKTDLTRH